MTLFAACSSEQMPEVSKQLSGDGIMFSTSLPLPTRGGDLVDDSFSQFFVTSYFGNHEKNDPYFSAETFTYSHDGKNEGERIFAPANPILWPVTNLEFFAWYPSTDSFYNGADASTRIENDADKGFMLKNFEVAPDIKDEIDLVTATKQSEYAEAATDHTVPLEFEHQLCQISVQGVVSASADVEGYDYEIAGIRLGNPNTKGTFNFNGINGEEEGNKGSWESTGHNAVEYIFGPGEKVAVLPKFSAEVQVDPVSLMGNGGPAMVLPTKKEAWNETYANSNKEAAPGEYSTDQMYLSVLIRVSRNHGIDLAFPYATRVEYPYRKELYEYYKVYYFAVDNETKEIQYHLFEDPEALYYLSYYDADGVKHDYLWPENLNVEGFSWAAVPIDVDWKAGNSYTYTLDYSTGLGLHDPKEPDPGEPIYNVKHPTVSWGYGVKWGVKVKKWTPATNYDPDIEVDFE